MIALEWILDLFLRVLGEAVLHGLAYGTGFAILKILSLGRLRIAPFARMGEWGLRRDRGIWLLRPGKPRILKAEVAVAVGTVFWIAALIGTGLWLAAGD